MVMVKRGEVFLANLEPVKGSEQGRFRPVLIIQNDLGNEYSTTTIVAPLTSAFMKNEYPFNVSVKSSEFLKKDSTVLLNQIRTIDKKRLAKKLGGLDNFTMNKVNKALKISLDLD
jgi:mRNA interferase MazF